MEYITPIVALLVALFLIQNRVFLDQITYSGNIIESRCGDKNDRLLIRTVQVLPIDDLLPSNILFRAQLLWAIYKCSKEDVFIRMSEKSMEILQPAIINGLAAIKGADTLDEIVQGRKPKHKTVLLAATFERYGGIKSQKIRAILIDPETLESILDGSVDVEKLNFEHAHHQDRINTLVSMALLWESEKKKGPEDFRIIRQVEIPM